VPRFIGSSRSPRCAGLRARPARPYPTLELRRLEVRAGLVSVQRHCLR
jgi:hypothetical protein